VNDESDLPWFTYPMSSRASELLQADVTIFNAFAAKVRTDLETILRDYEVADKATVRSWLPQSWISSSSVARMRRLWKRRK
jgi:hypothetical protein